MRSAIDLWIPATHRPLVNRPLRAFPAEVQFDRVDGWMFAGKHQTFQEKIRRTDCQNQPNRPAFLKRQAKHSAGEAFVVRFRAKIRQIGPDFEGSSSPAVAKCFRKSHLLWQKKILKVIVTRWILDVNQVANLLSSMLAGLDDSYQMHILRL